MITRNMCRVQSPMRGRPVHLREVLMKKEMWWAKFFDEKFFWLWTQMVPQERTRNDVEAVWQLLSLRKGSCVLDGACGYGRISKPLAERGALVTGVDRSETLIGMAESHRGSLGRDKLLYKVHDLRESLGNGSFDAAISLATSVGHDSKAADLLVFETLRTALCPKGLLFVETMHRDALVAIQCKDEDSSVQLSDGTIVKEQPRLEPLRGRLETVWVWKGPNGCGEKRASIRIYCVTELLALVKKAGFAVKSLHKGCSQERYVGEGTNIPRRVGLLLQRS